MSKKSEHMTKIKLEMAAKYDRLATITKSKPLNRQFKSRANKLRRQAANFARQ